MRVVVLILLIVLVAPMSLQLVIGQPDFILLTVNREGELVKVYPDGRVERLKGFLYNTGLEVLGDKVYTVEAVQYYKNLSKVKYNIIYKRRISNGEIVGEFLFPAIDKELGNLISPTAIEILPGGRIAVLDSYNDRVYIHKQEQRGGLITTIKLLSQHDFHRQSMEGLVVGGCLIVMSDGYGKILKINLSDYRMSVLKDFKQILDLSAITYASGYYFVASDNMIYVFREEGEITPLVRVPPKGKIVGLAVVGNELFASTTGGCIYRVDIPTIEVETLACGLGFLRDLEVYYPHGPIPANFTITPRKETTTKEIHEQTITTTTLESETPELESSTTETPGGGAEFTWGGALIPLVGALLLGVILGTIYLRRRGEAR